MQLFFFHELFLAHCKKQLLPESILRGSLPWSSQAELPPFCSSCRCSESVAGIAVTAFLCALCWCRHPSVGKETSTASGGTLPPEAGDFDTCLMACCTTNLERKAGNTFAQFCLDFSPESGYFLSLRVTST